MVKKTAGVFQTLFMEKHRYCAVCETQFSMVHTVVLDNCPECGSPLSTCGYTPLPKMRLLSGVLEEMKQ